MREKKRQRHLVLPALLLGLLLLTAAAGPAAAYDNGCASGQRGWDVLQPEYLAEVASRGASDGVTFQWDYFMVHDDDFTGSFGTVVANPRNDWLTSNLMPTGGSVAIAGKFLSGTHAGVMFANYRRFGKDATPGPAPEGWYTASADSREFHGEAPLGSDPAFYYGHIVPDGDGLRLSGGTDDFEWNLLMTQDWTERCDPGYLAAFPAVTGVEVGHTPFPMNIFIKNEFWSVDMPWMRTLVTGWIRDRNTLEVFDIDGHGYRETAWGPWAFNYSGWDFIIASDEATQVQWSLQTYHHSEALDYLDVSFPDGAELKNERFTLRGELGWVHEDWKFDTEARQCLPEDMIVVGRNDDYLVEAAVSINDTTEDNQIPMLSDLTPFTKEYTIVIRAATVDVTIRRAGTGEVVTQFQDKVGGGEFGIARRPEGSAPLTEQECAVWGGFYTRPLPAGSGCVDHDGDGYGYSGDFDCAHPEVLDCNDYNAEVNQGHAEVAGNGIDDDCDGIVDEACAVVPVATGRLASGLIPAVGLLLLPLAYALVVRRRASRNRGR